MVAQIGRFDERNSGILCCNLIGEPVNPVNQDAGKEEVGKDHDPFVTQLCRMVEAWFNQWKGNP